MKNNKALNNNLIKDDKLDNKQQIISENIHECRIELEKLKQMEGTNYSKNIEKNLLKYLSHLQDEWAQISLEIELGPTWTGLQNYSQKSFEFLPDFE